MLHDNEDGPIWSGTDYPPPPPLLSVAQAYNAYRAGLIDWDSVRRVQDASYPRCEQHPDRPAKGAPGLCIACAEQLIHELHWHLKSQALILGGYAASNSATNFQEV